ncbi:protein TBATA isoform X3 [Alexandromys fortis]|uniref:protein TBATA isoform X3 n=1 Tax=Alexandromys fortis TaxID=100897 RepID=UPI00215268DA|nr:protein TBATA isoform X3 [Microtus fortis]
MIRGVSTGTQPTLAKMQEIAMRGWSSLKRKKPGSSLRWCPVQSPSQRSLIAHSSLCTHHQSTRAAPSIENTGIRILVFTSLVANPVMTTEVKTQVAEQPLVSPKAEPEPEKKPEHFPKSHGDVGFQKEPVVPGIVDFELIQEELKTSSKPQTPSAYRFGRLSHHSFFSRHHPQPQHVTHIQDLTGKPVCVVRDEFSLAPVTQSALLSSSLMGMPTISVPIGDPQSNRNPQLPPDLWKKNLKDLASQVAVFTKENESRTNEAGAEPKSEPGKKALPKEEPPVREQGAKYSAETGRLIPASSQALSRRNRQGQRGHPSARDGGAQASLLEDQELLILELLCQILQTDSLSAIQFWLLYAPPKGEDTIMRPPLHVEGGYPSLALVPDPAGQMSLSLFSFLLGSPKASQRLLIIIPPSSPTSRQHFCGPVLWRGPSLVLTADIGVWTGITDKDCSQQTQPLPVTVGNMHISANTRTHRLVQRAHRYMSASEQ